MGMPEKLAKRLMDVCVELNTIEKRKHLEQYGATTAAEFIHFKDRGQKFVAIDIGGSGAWMVEKATGEIFNIKGYGNVDRNKKKKADIGNIYTVDLEQMHNKRWNYLR